MAGEWQREAVNDEFTRQRVIVLARRISSARVHGRLSLVLLFRAMRSVRSGKRFSQSCKSTESCRDDFVPEKRFAVRAVWRAREPIARLIGEWMLSGATEPLSGRF